jgi:hypothetical protein
VAQVPLQMDAGPDMGPGKALTVTVLMTVQPVGNE